MYKKKRENNKTNKSWHYKYYQHIKLMLMTSIRVTI